MPGDVLDASAMLALIKQEPGAGLVADLLDASEPDIAISSVNFCEVQTKLIRNGALPDDIETAVKPFQHYVVDFTLDQAIQAGELTRTTRALGLSLGDRACLVPALSRQATVWTTDRIWLSASLGVKIQLLR